MVVIHNSMDMITRIIFTVKPWRPISFIIFNEVMTDIKIMPKLMSQTLKNFLSICLNKVDILKMKMFHLSKANITVFIFHHGTVPIRTFWMGFTSTTKVSLSKYFCLWVLCSYTKKDVCMDFGVFETGNPGNLFFANILTI